MKDIIVAQYTNVFLWAMYHFYKKQNKNFLIFLLKKHDLLLERFSWNQNYHNNGDYFYEDSHYKTQRHLSTIHQRYHSYHRYQVHLLVSFLYQTYFYHQTRQHFHIDCYQNIQYDNLNYLHEQQTPTLPQKEI